MSADDDERLREQDRADDELARHLSLLAAILGAGDIARGTHPDNLQSDELIQDAVALHDEALQEVGKRHVAPAADRK